MNITAEFFPDKLLVDMTSEMLHNVEVPGRCRLSHLRRAQSRLTGTGQNDTHRKPLLPDG
jgi:hypothetical protein